MKLMRSVRRNMDCLTTADRALLASKRGFHFAFKKDECFLKIMAMRRRPAAGWNMHVNQAISAVSVGPGKKNRVGVSYDSKMRHIVTVWISNDKIPLRIVRWNYRA